MQPAPHPAESAPAPLRTEIGRLFQLAWPVVATQLGLMLMGVVDTIMLGRYSSHALEAVASASVFIHITFVVPLGVLMGLDPVISQAWGAGDHRAVGHAHKRGMFLALAMSIPLMLSWTLCGELMRLTAQPGELIPAGTEYGLACVAGAWPLLAFMALRNTLQGMGVVRTIAIVAIGGNVINYFANLVFIWGWPALGIPELGVLGAGLATSASRIVVFGMLLGAALWGGWLKRVVPGREDGEWRLLEWAGMKRILYVGVPVGFHFLVESGVFGLFTLMIGWTGASALGGHLIAINMASLAFMLPLGVSIAAAVRVGHCIGARQPEQARRSARLAVVAGGAVMLPSTLMFALLPGVLIAIYTGDPAVTAVALTLMPLAAAFQLFDGLQVICFGVLRGTADTRVPALIGFVGFWVIALPLAYALLQAGAGAVGIWSAIVIGLTSVAVAGYLRMRHRLSGDLEPLADHVASEAPAVASPVVVPGDLMVDPPDANELPVEASCLPVPVQV
ncbi:MAG: MATE family efflux transporter [Planctomycetota bacterium]